MFNAEALLSQFLGADTQATLNKGKDYISQNAGSLASGAAIGGLGGYMLGSKNGRKVAKKAATYGGMALLAGLAYKAYKNYQNPNQNSAQNPNASSAAATDMSNVPASFQIEAQTGTRSFGATLISAMIAAAKADGQIDGVEHQAIFSKIEELNLDNDEKAFLFDQLNNPVSIDALVSAASTKEQAVEIYVASLVAVDVDTAAEKAYLSMLAARLGLEEDLVNHIHSTIEQETS
ncbi:MAG: tellurite resistance TerB family protein [Gammaproteobacteria bacterium]|jgi:uncharacterized membrane protein YebE (DUF533 family)